MTPPSISAMIMDWLILLFRGPIHAYQQQLKLWEAELQARLLREEVRKAIKWAAYWKAEYLKKPSAVHQSALSSDEIKRLIKLCHPDKHGNSKEANELTAKLLSLR